MCNVSGLAWREAQALGTLCSSGPQWKWLVWSGSFFCIGWNWSGASGENGGWISSMGTSCSEKSRHGSLDVSPSTWVSPAELCLTDYWYARVIDDNRDKIGFHLESFEFFHHVWWCRLLAFGSSTRIEQARFCGFSAGTSLLFWHREFRCKASSCLYSHFRTIFSSIQSSHLYPLLYLKFMQVLCLSSMYVKWRQNIFTLRRQ